MEDYGQEAEVLFRHNYEEVFYQRAFGELPSDLKSSEHWKCPIARSHGYMNVDLLAAAIH